MTTARWRSGFDGGASVVGILGMRFKVAPAAFLHRKRPVVGAEADVDQLGLRHKIHEIAAARQMLGIDLRLHGDARGAHAHGDRPWLQSISVVRVTPNN